MIARRQALLAIGSTCLVSAVAQAQTAPKVALIGRLHPGSPKDPAQVTYQQAFREGMAALGHHEGRTYRVEMRFAEGDVMRLPALAVELVQARADVIVTGGTLAAEAAKGATNSIPIVMAMSGPDPVTLGLVASIARPGGNVTGFTGMIDELPVKHLELLREIVPELTDVLVLFNPAGSVRPINFLAQAAATLGVTLHRVAVSGAADIDDALDNRNRSRTTGVIVLADPIILDRHRGDIAERALRQRLPVASPFRMTAEAGSLVSYAEDLVDMHRRSAEFVDKILRGAKPADLPVLQPSRFELVVNLKTARAIGVTIPPALIARADEVIE